MEVLSNKSQMRTILVILKPGDEAEAFCAVLERSYQLIRCDNVPRALETMKERLNNLSATIIEYELASQNSAEFLRSVIAERSFDTIPVIIATHGEPTSEHAHCLDEGAVGLVALSCDETILKHRVNNAIQLRRSATFYEIESMLRVLPSMIFLKDTEGRYVFSTQYWHHLKMGDDPLWTIRGKTDIDIRKDRENALKAMEADKEIIRTGKGTSYTIEINTDGIREFVQLIKEPVFDENGNVVGIIALGNDVTESELLKRELQKRALVDDLTGLGNRAAFREYVEDLPNRTDYPIAIISADCDNLKKVNDTHGHILGDEYIRMTSAVMKGTLDEIGAIFRTGGDEFVAFVPHTTKEQAGELVAHMRRRAQLFKMDDEKTDISYGISSLADPEDDVRAALDRADRAMYADKASHKALHH